MGNLGMDQHPNQGRGRVEKPQLLKLTCKLRWSVVLGTSARCTIQVMLGHGFESR